MLVNISIVSDPNNVQRFSTALEKNLIAKLEDKLHTLALLTKNVMYTAISSKAKRKFSGNLGRWIEVEEFRTPDGYWVGIGNIATLNAKAKYWYVLNYGKKLSGQTFYPGGSSLMYGGQTRPVHIPGGGVIYRTIPTLMSTTGKISRNRMGFKPIQPFNYIQTAVNWLSANLSSTFTI